MARKKKVILSLVGARPQFVKLAPLAARLKKEFRHIIVHSGQHYSAGMSDVFFSQLKIPSPDINLSIGSGSHGKQTGKMLEKFESVLFDTKPDMVLIYGDTNTTLAGALAASKLHIPIGHIEAGLRSFKNTMPEEINRKVADTLSDILFYPTPVARKNLIAEGVTKGLVKSGDLMYEILDACTRLSLFKRNHYKQFDLKKNAYGLVTLHRAENSDDPERLKRFVTILESAPIPMLFLMHPRTKKNLKTFDLLKRLKQADHIIVKDPLSYIETLSLISNARILLTDSGGMQKEAYFLGCPCVTLRPETEWVETVQAGVNILADMKPGKVLGAFRKGSFSRKKVNYLINGRKPSDVIAGAISSFLREIK